MEITLSNQSSRRVGASHRPKRQGSQGIWDLSSKRPFFIHMSAMLAYHATWPSCTITCAKGLSCLDESNALCNLRWV
eukprot:scaffold52268_cov15-Prasinocladus_malaysianus.AAC.1